MPTFIGLDLAWGGRNPHGFCVLEGENGKHPRCTYLGARPDTVRTLTEGITRVAERSRPVVVAIDAPLKFPSDSSLERPVDVEVHERFRRYKIRPLSARKARDKGQIAGIELGKALEERGFTLDPTALLAKEGGDRVAFEVFPHTIHVRLFGLKTQLFYKHGSLAEKRQGLLQYQAHLRGLLEREEPGLLQSESIGQLLAAESVARAEEPAIKTLDDTLDGLTCALAAWLAWRDPGGWEMLGDMTGYMVMPRTDRG